MTWRAIVHETVGEGHRQERRVARGWPARPSRGSRPDGPRRRLPRTAAPGRATRGAPPRSPPGAARGGSRARHTTTSSAPTAEGGQGVGDRGAHAVDREGRGPTLREARRERAHRGRVPRRGAEADEGRAHERAAEPPGATARQKYPTPMNTSAEARMTALQSREGVRQDAGGQVHRPRGQLAGRLEVAHLDLVEPEALGDRREHDREHRAGTSG